MVSPLPVLYLVVRSAAKLNCRLLRGWSSDLPEMRPVVMCSPGALQSRRMGGLAVKTAQ
jgi:hypothetical protein